MEFNKLQLEDFGHKLMASGIIYTNGVCEYNVYFPNEVEAPEQDFMHPTIEEWEALLKQTDDVRVLSSRDNPLLKAFVKKSQRNIDQSICWGVYSRDNYSCRYCGRTGVPLTVDHIDLWTDGGITTPENLNTACKHCNRDRGDMPYTEWLASSQYAQRSVALPEAVKQANIGQIKILPELEKRRVNYKRAPR